MGSFSVDWSTSCRVRPHEFGTCLKRLAATRCWPRATFTDVCPRRDRIFFNLQLPSPGIKSQALSAKRAANMSNMDALSMHLLVESTTTLLLQAQVQAMALHLATSACKTHVKCLQYASAMPGNISGATVDCRSWRFVQKHRRACWRWYRPRSDD